MNIRSLSVLSRRKHLLNLFSITAFDASTANGGTIANNGDNTFTYASASNFTGENSLRLFSTH